MSAYRVSDFCHLVEVENGFVGIYNSLSLGIVFIEESIAKILRNAIGKTIDANAIPREVLVELEDRRIVFPLGERIDLKDYLDSQKLLNDNGIAILYLLLTDNCNLGCTYCYIVKGLPAGYRFSIMTKDVIDEALSVFARSISSYVDEPKIVLYGGEPLLNMEGACYAIARYNELLVKGALPSKTDLVINTNATLINREFLEFAKNKNVQFAVSLDGNQEIHDSMRRYKNGDGSFEKVMENCRLMREMHINFGFSVTITKANIFSIENVLNWIYNEFNIDSIGFNISIDQSFETIGMTGIEYAELITEKLISCFKICRKRGIYEDRIMRKINAFVSGYPYIYDCGAPGDQLVVTPDGFAGVCQAYCGDKRNFVPLEKLGDLATNPIWQEWRYRSPLYQDQCYHCISLGLCGGGCPYNAELKTGSIWGVDEVFCIHSKKTLDFMIKDLFRQTSNRS